MQKVTIILSALALSALTLTSAHAREYLTHDRIYANENSGQYYSGTAAYRGNANHYTNPRLRYLNSRYGNQYRNQYQQRLQAEREEARKPKYKSPTYVKKAVNFHKSASKVRMERIRQNAKPASQYSNAALNVQLVNMRNKNLKTVRRPTQNQVILPTVTQEPVRIAQSTPARVTQDITPTVTPSYTAPTSQVQQTSQRAPALGGRLSHALVDHHAR